MKNYLKIAAVSLVFVIPQGCDLVDPTEVVNPNIVQEVIVGTANSTELYLNGMNRQMALVYNAMVDILELGSDNYDNTQTFYNQNFDVLDITFQDVDINGLQFTLADLREGAKFGIEAIHPGDPVSTDDQLAELYFFRGWAYLLSGEIFNVLPGEGGGSAVPGATHISLAIADFLQAETLDGTNASYKLALARAYYSSGDQTNAVLKSNQAIAANATFTRGVAFDAINGPTSVMQDALQDRGNFDDYQPLPSMDFLDPKYYARPGGTTESTIWFQKIEEAHLILAEAEIADADLPGARTVMKNVIALVGTRTKDTFSDAVDQRTNLTSKLRPDVATAQVRYGSDPYRSGLVLTRSTGTVTIGTISDTSLDDAYIDAQITEDDMLEALYLLRQEVFFAEGRRFIDLGIKLPVSEVEQLSNANITSTDILAVIPAFLPTDMDAFTYDASTPGSEVCTITHNMNAVLAANKTSNAVLPFH